MAPMTSTYMLRDNSCIAFFYFFCLYCSISIKAFFIFLALKLELYKYSTEQHKNVFLSTRYKRQRENKEAHGVIKKKKMSCWVF